MRFFGPITWHNRHERDSVHNNSVIEEVVGPENGSRGMNLVSRK
jgi:hypothetical protein